MSVRVVALCACACVFAVPSLAAQGALERTVTGIVKDSVSGRGVRGALVYFDGQRTEGQSGRDGRFTIEHVSADDTLLMVRTVGFVPTRVVVPFSPSAAVVDVGHVIIRQVATRLDQIAVEAEAVHRYPHMEQFYRRKQLGQSGEFITRDDIERSGVRKTSEALFRSAKLDMDCPQDPMRAGDDRCIPRDRRGLDYKVTSGVTSRCVKEVFVDGKLSLLAVDEVPVTEIAGIEIYAGPATTPAEFGQRRCGVIAIWTTGASRD